MRLFVRLSLLGLVLLVAIGFAINLNQSQAIEESIPVSVETGMCLDAGTSLVVDFGSGSDKPTETKCVQNFKGYSWDFFEAAGLEVSGTDKYPVGFVCRIEGLPSEDEEPCADTPGTKNGSWAYFLGDEKNKWQYSPIGASTHKVKCGVSEGWRFLLPGEPIQTPPRISLNSYACKN
jgi:hypothetical protein